MFSFCFQINSLNEKNTNIFEKLKLSKYSKIQSRIYVFVFEYLLASNGAPVGDGEHDDLFALVELERVLLERLAHQLHAAHVLAAARHHCV